MKRTVQSVAFSFGLLLGAGITAKAQLMPGMVDMMPSINTTINNSINMSRTRILSGAASKSSARAAYKKRVEATGAAKIKAGKATTVFVSSASTTQLLAKNMDWNDEGDPQDLDGQVKYIQQYVKQFDALMAQNGFKTNDFSDGYAFAYALAYAAYLNKNADKVEVEKIRETNRKQLLANSFVQGAGDEHLQYDYEQNAVMAAQAAEQRALYRRATTEAERQKYDAKAKHFARFMLDIKD